MYEQFASTFDFCWACGRLWVFGLENAHIIGGSGRTHDRRNITRLCGVCHKLAHGHTIRDQDGSKLPLLKLPHLLWLKARLDPEWYDVRYLKSLRIKRREPLRQHRVPHIFFEAFMIARGEDHYGKASWVF